VLRSKVQDGALVSGTKTQARFPILPGAPKGVHVCTSCQHTVARFSCCSEDYAQSRYRLTSDELEALEHKWARVEGGGRYAKNYVKQFLRASVIELSRKKDAAVQAAALLATQARAAKEAAWTNKVIAQEAAMVNLFTGEAEHLQDALKDAKLDFSTNSATHLYKQYFDLLNQTTPLQAKQVDEFVRYHSALSEIDEKITDAFEAKNKEAQLDVAMERLDSVPGGARASAGLTWREIFAGEKKYAEELKAFMAAIQRAVKAAEKAQAKA